MTNYSKKDVCAAFVLYNPDKEQFLRSLSSARSADLNVVVVDNTPSRLLKFDIVSGVTYIANGDNLGIAKALNQAAEESRSLGFRICMRSLAMPLVTLMLMVGKQALLLMRLVVKLLR